MWQPDPAWRVLPSGRGPATVGVWCTERDGRRLVVKRLRRPEPGETVLEDPEHAGYWRREAEVALDVDLLSGPGLVGPIVDRVEDDDEGVTIWTDEVVGEPPPGLFVARALGRFAGRTPPSRPWLARRMLSDRLAMAERRGGWPTLQRTTLADATDLLWRRRGHWLDTAAAGPIGLVHGDAVPGNFLAARGEDVVAVDWQCLGLAPVGTDLGYYALSTREDFEVLLEAFVAGAVETGASVDVEAVTLAARVAAVYTVVSRAEWALANAARGEGALAGKFRHPSVAPHLRALQRQLTQIEALLT